MEKFYSLVKKGLKLRQASYPLERLKRSKYADARVTKLG